MRGATCVLSKRRKRKVQSESHREEHSDAEWQKEKQQETPYAATPAANLAAYTGSMRKPRSTTALVRLATMFTLLLGVNAPPTLWAQARLENPSADSFQSGIGVVSG